MALQSYIDPNPSTNLTLECEPDHYTIRFFDNGVRIASVQIVGVGVDSCHIKDFSMLSGFKLTPSLGKLLLRYLKHECKYKKISFERKRNDFVKKEYSI